MKLQQQINRKQMTEMRQGSISKTMRRARTRTLIQLGGLIEKSGLLDVLEIQLGQDLQKDAETINPVATLMGSLLSLCTLYQDEDSQTQKMLWQRRGKEALRHPDQPQPMKSHT